MVLSYRKRLLQTTFIPEKGDKPNAQSPFLPPFGQINRTFWIFWDSGFYCGWILNRPTVNIVQ